MLQFDTYESLENPVGRKDRYRYAKVTIDTQPYFLKQALTKQEQENLRRELVWQDFMHHVERRHPELNVRALRDIRIINDDTLLAEWVDAPLVSHPGDAIRWREHLQRYTAVLIALDTVAESYEVPAPLRTYAKRNMHERLDFWLRGIARTPLINKAYDQVIDKLDGINSIVQHGDLTPWQIFDTDREWVIIDGERSGDDLPRFNDIAYSYGRLAARCGDESAADQMLQDFIKNRMLTPDMVISQLHPVLLFRLLGMLGDAAEDVNSEEYRRVEAIITRHIEQVAT